MYRLLLLIPLFILSCSNSPVLPPSTGAVNEVLIVMDDHLWQGPSGDSLRHYLSADVKGIAWSEPQFNIVQIPLTSYSRIFQTHRNTIVIQAGDLSKVAMSAPPQAQNQWLAVVEYDNKSHLPILLGQYAPIFSDRILEEERKRFKANKRFKPVQQIDDLFGLTLSIPEKYTNVLDTNRFVWYQYSPKELETIQGILVYELPSEIYFGYHALMAARDSLLQAYVPGPTAGSYMTTEYLHYDPYVTTHQQGYVVKGLWRLENAFMGGPFITYFIKDSVRQKTLAIEGFLFNPGENKRNLLQEMEWVIADFKTEQ